MNSFVLQGKYVQGCGRAHQFGEVYRQTFGCPMVATFNVDLDAPITMARPARVVDLTWPGEPPKPVTFWLCRINGYFAWALRWKGTTMPETRVEFVSKRELPGELKISPLRVEVFERWPGEKIREWGTKEYQWQGFPWLSKQRVDSEAVWKVIGPSVSWSGLNVLDVGSHYGYHSFRASKLGAYVTAVEPDDATRAKGELIARHIEMEDVQFEGSLSFKVTSIPWDIVLYLSVQHQWDPDYTRLAEKVAELLCLTRRALFVEVILPPLFGKKYTPEEIDKKVGGRILHTYRHRMRGYRRIYIIKKDRC